MINDQDTLGPYKKKRDFRKTPEPNGERRDTGELRRQGNPVFVIQQHAATSLHWDFRIEVNGVLKSWAVPKGPSTDPREKRLAVATEDHPLDYLDFEGVIPEGRYGAGSVIVWDTGPYKNLSREQGDEKGDGDEKEMAIDDALERGHADIWLEGKKLRGGYALVHSRTGGDDNNWLLIKMKDEGADARRNPTSTEPRSVLSDRTVEELAEQEAKQKTAEDREGPE